MDKLYRHLLEKALEAEQAYYQKDSPIMSDSSYDAIVRQLAYIEKLHPDWKAPSSPTHRVGGCPANTFEKVVFPTKMLSLKNAFNEDDIKAFLKEAKKYTDEYIIQPKLDGLTLVLFYDRGLLTRAVTRGNGQIGEDVTLNALNLEDIPKQVGSVAMSVNPILVRGEIVMHKDDFEALNQEQADAGKAAYANPRNVAAGSIRQKDPSAAGKRKLHFYAYDMPGTHWAFEDQMLTWLENNGFKTPSTWIVKRSEVMAQVNYVKEHEEALLPYAIDGAVVKTHRRAGCHEFLGETSHDPNWAIAFKFTPVSAITTLKDIIYQVGRTGNITPVAVLEPVELCGSVVSRATLHNEAFMNELGLSKGDEVTVFKAAEIIPEIDAVVVKSDNDPERFTDVCPSCGKALNKRGEYWICDNAECPGKILAAACYFVSRDCMDIRGMAESVLLALISSKKIKRIADIYSLQKEDLLYPGLIAEKKAESLFNEIQKSKEKPFDRVLCALGVSRIASSTATVLANHFLTIECLCAATVEEIAELEGLGMQSAQIIHAGLHAPETQADIIALIKAGLQFTQKKKELDGVQLAGMSICITGTLSKPRDEWKQLIVNHGGKFATSVTSKTTYLVAGDGGGEKRAKAQKLGVPIISEKELEEMLQ